MKWFSVRAALLGSTVALASLPATAQEVKVTNQGITPTEIVQIGRAHV